MIETPAAEQVETLAAAKDRIHQVGKIGYVVNVFIKSRKRKADSDTHDEQIYKIIKLSEREGARCQSIDDTNATMSIDLNQLKDDWSIVQKFQPQTQIEGWHTAMPCASAEWAIDLVKGGIARELYKLCLKHDQKSNDLINIFIHPTCVKAKKRIGKGEAVLSPLGRSIGSRNLGDPAPKKCADLGELKLPFGEDKATAFHIPYSFKHSATADGTNWIAPFWLVTDADSEENANVAIVQKPCSFEIGEHTCKFSVPVLQNAKVIAKDATLFRKP